MTHQDIMWHADGDGKCHKGCEAYEETKQGAPCCAINAVMPWCFEYAKTGPGQNCPFAVLAEVFRLHESKP